MGDVQEQVGEELRRAFGDLLDSDTARIARELDGLADRLLQVVWGANPVLADVLAERVAQDIEWGGPAHDDEHDRDDWLGFVSEHKRRALAAAMRTGKDNDATYRRQMIRVAALAVAAVESFDRKTGRPDAGEDRAWSANADLRPLTDALAGHTPDPIGPPPPSRPAYEALDLSDTEAELHVEEHGGRVPTPQQVWASVLKWVKLLAWPTLIVVLVVVFVWGDAAQAAAALVAYALGVAGGWFQRGSREYGLIAARWRELLDREKRLAPLVPRPGRGYVGCPTCGFVTTVPAAGFEEPLPWCVHNNSYVAWREPSSPESDWTRMRPVVVRDGS